MKKESFVKEQVEVLTNTTLISLKDYSKYRDFTAIATTKRGLNRIIQGLISLATATFIIPLIMVIATAFENNEQDLVILNIFLLLGTTFASLLNFYAFFTYNKSTLLARRLGMFVTCSVLSIFLKDEFGKDFFLTSFMVLLPIATFIGLFLPYILVKKEYQRIANMKYEYKFYPDYINVVVTHPAQEAPRNVDLKYQDTLAFYELSDVFYLFINQQQAIFIKKSSFINGDDEKLLNLFARNQKIARLTKW